MAITRRPELDQQARVVDSDFTGMAYIRVLSVPKGEVVTALGSGGTLALGSVLPAAWGGPATATALDPRLQTVERAQNNEGAFDRLVATYISVDALAGGTKYHECARRPTDSINPSERNVLTVGVVLAADEADGEVPAAGDSLDDPSTVLTPMAQSRQFDRAKHYGRTFVRTTWIGLIEGSTATGTDSKELSRRRETLNRYAYQITVQGVHPSDNTGGRPVSGDWLDGRATDICNPMFAAQILDYNRHVGRTFVTTTYIGFVGKSLASTAYRELDARETDPYGDPEGVVTRSVGLAATIADAPAVGTTLGTPDMALARPSILLNSQIDTKTYPGRIVVHLTYMARRNASEMPSA